MLELLDLFSELWGMLRVYRTRSRYKFSQLEAFLILVPPHAGCTGRFQSDCKHTRCISGANEIFGVMNKELHDIGLDMMQDLALFEDYVPVWAAACKAKGVFSNLNLIGYIEGKVHEICLTLLVLRPLLLGHRRERTVRAPARVRALLRSLGRVRVRALLLCLAATTRQCCRQCASSSLSSLSLLVCIESDC